MADNTPPIINAILDGMTDGIENQANKILEQLKAQQAKGEASASTAHQIEQLQALVSDIASEREKRNRQEAAESTPEPSPEPANEQLKPWWKDTLNQPDKP